MGKAMKFAVVLFAVVGMVGVVMPAYSQEKTEQQLVTSVLAEVASVDLEKSTVVIKTVKDPVLKTYENQTISVLPETKVLKGDVVLKPSDLKAGDKVTVKYTADALGKWKVESISVEVAEAVPAK
jgi:uncharacterized membrane protein